MNDFTKEELLVIKDALDERAGVEGIQQILDKTQEMIDSYCDHQYKKTLDKSGMYFISMCHECKDTKPWSIFDE